MKSFILIIITMLLYNCVFSQEYGWVSFTDKKNTSFNPVEYFHPTAIERRILNGLNLYDSTDFPINEEYIKTIEAICGEVLGFSRWFNAVFVNTSSEDLQKIIRLPFVKSFDNVVFETYQASVLQLYTNCDKGKLVDEKTSNFECNAQVLQDRQTLYSNETYIEEVLANQTRSLEGHLFADMGITGKGVRIAVFDGGFPNVNTHEVFEHLRANNRIVKTWDFVSKKENVYSSQSHGTTVLSCISGIYKEQAMGLAPDAEFLLARTEKITEPFSEEKNWAMAAEWADKNGAHIINSSLGYTYHRYFPWDMDGKKSYVTRAANMAARKGLLVVNAAGNEGYSKWKIIGAPADADSVLSVGGIDPDTYYKINFSSFGPTADKRLKPNVSAFGKTVAANKKGIDFAEGTSFASPLVAGFAACVKQINPHFTNMELFKEIEKSAHLYPYFDYAHGYGMPQASYFLNTNNIIEDELFSINIYDNTIKVEINENYISNNNNYLYFHFANNDGQLVRYGLIDVYQSDALVIYDAYKYVNHTFRVLYKGKLIEKIIN